MKKMNKKGFTLLEILAVIIIIAALMIIAVPAVTKYIQSTKLNTYKSTLKNMVSTVDNEVIAGHLEDYRFDEDLEYMIVPLTCIELEKGDNYKSPFANYIAAYSFIIVEATDIGYNYKIQAIDELGFGTYLTKPEEIKIEEININNLSYLTKIDDDYNIELKNYSNSKTPYIITCEALEQAEMPTIPDNTTPTSTTIKEQILLNNTSYADNISSTYVSASTGINFSEVNSTTNGKGLYSTSKNTEGNQPTYYFRGTVDNNNVQFGEYKAGTVIDGYTFTVDTPIYWKIVRINEDGSIRLIYNGTGDDDPFIAFSGFSTSSKSKDNTYVGYMYGNNGATTYALTHQNNNNSTIKTIIDEWYQNNLLKYSNYIADSGFCGDRSLTTGTGIATSNTDYGVIGRLKNNKTPQFACPNESRDLYTTSTSSKGNKKLTYPVGLITADEVAFAGGVFYKDNSDYYLYINYDFWTMSPGWSLSSSVANWILSDRGRIDYEILSTKQIVRPVINLKPTVELSKELPTGCAKQTGTEACPYIIKVS